MSSWHPLQVSEPTYPESLAWLAAPVGAALCSTFRACTCPMDTRRKGTNRKGSLPTRKCMLPSTGRGIQIARGALEPMTSLAAQVQIKNQHRRATAAFRHEQWTVA